jgi:hypothetical protein
MLFSLKSLEGIDIRKVVWSNQGTVPRDDNVAMAILQI